MNRGSDIDGRLARIKDLWLELEKVRPNTPRYEELVQQIKAESSAFLALDTTTQDVDEMRTRIDTDRRQIDRRQAARRNQ
jgi:hypothetical protein